MRIIGSGETIVLPPQSSQVEHEGELVVVIGKRGKNITAENSRKHIMGYTVGNDVTARNLQKSDGQWTRAKGFDTFCPFGSWIDTEFDPADAVVTVRVNGQMRQMASTLRGHLDRLKTRIFPLLEQNMSPEDEHKISEGLNAIVFENSLKGDADKYVKLVQSLEDELSDWK